MSFATATAADLLRSLNVEVVIFLVTLTFALAFRGISAKLPGARPAKDRIAGKGSREACTPAADGPPTPQKSRHGGGARHSRVSSGELQSPAAHDRGGAVAQQRRQPGQIMDEVVDGMREQPGARFAARALALYAELMEELRRGDLCIATVAKGSRHSPIDLYTTLVQCVMRVGKCHLVEDLIEDMRQQGISRPLVFYESAMKQLAGQKHYHLALRIYDHLVADGLAPSAVTCSCLISFAAEIGEFQRAATFFQKLSSLTTPSIRAYMTVLRVYGRRQDWQSSVSIFHDMQHRGVKIDSLVLNVILATGVSADQLQGMEELLSEADCIRPPIVDVVSYNTLVKCYAQHNDFEGAAAVLGRMRRRGLTPNAITFNSVMDAAVRSQKISEAWELLKEMRRAGLQPDKFTCSILVKGLAQHPIPVHVLSTLDLLREVDVLCDKSLRTTLYHAVVEAAAQAGETDLLMRSLLQARQHQVVPTAAAYRRLRELAEKHGLALGTEHGALTATAP
mmetsp:Transcript_117816/g.380211  ORF Transcript_117816/g.380211 Transcript_117816/m.380211 type:complete len:508 (+) Transcript_117816:195-1718(+)